MTSSHHHHMPDVAGYALCCCDIPARFVGCHLYIISSHITASLVLLAFCNLIPCPPTTTPFLGCRQRVFCVRWTCACATITLRFAGFPRVREQRALAPAHAAWLNTARDARRPPRVCAPGLPQQQRSDIFTFASISRGLDVACAESFVNMRAARAHARIRARAFACTLHRTMLWLCVVMGGELCALLCAFCVACAPFLLRAATAGIWRTMPPVSSCRAHYFRLPLYILYLSWRGLLCGSARFLP